MRNLNSFLAGWALLSTAALLSACGSSAPAFAPQAWEDVQINVETRPPQVEPGMNEFLVIASRGRNKPAFDLMVSFAINNTDRWQQAILVGLVGVFWRVFCVGVLSSVVLFV